MTPQEEDEYRELQNRADDGRAPLSEDERHRLSTLKYMLSVQAKRTAGGTRPADDSPPPRVVQPVSYRPGVYGFQDEDDTPTSLAKAFALKTSVANGRASGGQAPDIEQNPERKGGLAEAMDKLREAIEKRTRQAEQTGRAAGGQSPGGAGGWASGVLNRYGDRLTQGVHQTASRLFGKEAGDAIGRGTNRLVSKGVERLRRLGTQRAAGAARGGRAAGGASKALAGAGRTAAGAAEGAGGSAATGGAAAAEGAAAGAGGAAGALPAASAVGPAGIAVAAILVAVEAVGKLKDAVVEGSARQHETNMRYAEFSSRMGAVQSREEMDQARRRRDVGDATAATAGGLQVAKSRWDDQEAEWEKAGANVKNAALTVALEALAEVLRPFTTGIASKLNDWLDAQLGSVKNGPSLQDHIDQAQKEADANKASLNDWVNRRPFPPKQ
jgi:hypothetical protein